MSEDDNRRQFWSSALPSTFSTVCITSAAAIAAWTIIKKKISLEIPKTERKTEVVAKAKPQKWVQVGKVEKLIIYPIKSCQGVIVNEAVITTLGLKFKDYHLRDRDFMLVDDKGRSITQKQQPIMALISMKVGGKDEITLEAPDMEPCTFSFPKGEIEDEKLCRVKHDKGVRALDCGDKVSEWFQVYLGISDLRLYYHHINETQRTFEPYMHKAPQFEHSDMGSFHNETSYLMVAQESIDELNKRLEKNSSWRNWRPTILIDNIQEPFAEVNWSFVRIGNDNGILKAAVPCYRCPLTTVDPDVGILPDDGEPLKTLREMNRADCIDDKSVGELLKSKGIMGLRLGLYLPAGEGAILKTGDPVYAALL